MAQQNLNTGSSANDGTGDSLRASMLKIQDNFDELYGDETTAEVNSVTAGTGLSVDQTTGAVIVSLDAHTGDVTGTTALTIASDAVTYDKMQDTSTNNRLLGAATAGTIAEVQVATDMIADDAVTADKLADSINTEISDNTAKVTNATHTGDVTGATALTIASNIVDADRLNVTGNGTSGQALLSDGDGTFSWGSAGNTYTAGDGLTLNTLDFDINVDDATIEIDSDTLRVKADGIDANEINVTGNGSAGQNLSSDGSGGFTWTNEVDTTYTAGDGLTLNTLDFDLDADLTTVTSIYNTGLKVGRDSAGDWIDFGTDSQIDFYIDNANDMRLESDGDLHVEGDVIAASTTIASDEKLKENIEEYSDALDKIKQLKGVSFDWKKDGSKSGGVIAQDVQKVLPELVQNVEDLNGDDSHLAVNYNGLIGVLLQSIKELSDKVDNCNCKNNCKQI